MSRRITCPTCRTPVAWQGNPHRPFCSPRCRTIDLGAWADESYRIPGDPVDLEAEMVEQYRKDQEDQEDQSSS